MRDGEIEAVDDPVASRAEGVDRTIDANGCWVMPGLIDPHVHLRDPGFPQKETIATGFAPRPPAASLPSPRWRTPRRSTTRPTIDALHARSRARGSRDAPDAGLRCHERARGAELVDFAAMVEAGARLFSDDGIPIDDQVILSRALDELAASTSRSRCTKRIAHCPKRVRPTPARCRSASA